MRSILEKAFVALLNEEQDKAEELFHKFIVERARQIHESNRAGDDYVLDENWNDEITTESYFTEDDLTDLEDDNAAEGGEGEEAGDDFAGEDDVDGIEGAEGDDFSAEEPVDGIDGDIEGDVAGEELDVEERLDSLEDKLAQMSAEFEAAMDAISDDAPDAELDADDADLGGDDFGAEGGEADFGGESDEDVADTVEDDMDGAEDEQPAMEGEEADDEFDDITESIIDELEKVSVSLDDGKEIGTGAGFTQNRGAAIPQKSKDARQGGAPIKSKQSQHKGFERETAPAVDTLKARRNNVSSADAALSKVSKEGDKSAEINKLSSENGNTKSPLEGK